jgi:hypothetical protein
VHLHPGGHLPVDPGQELLPLGGAVLAVQFVDDQAGGDVQGGEQRRGAVADVVMGPLPGMPGIVGSTGVYGLDSVPGSVKPSAQGFLIAYPSSAESVPWKLPASHRLDYIGDVGMQH